MTNKNGKIISVQVKAIFQKETEESHIWTSIKNFQISNRNKDIDTTWSYSDNCKNDMSQGTRTYTINFYCGADPPCDSLLAGHRTSVKSSSSSSNNSSPKNSDDGSSSEGDSEYSDNEDNVWNSTYAQNCLAMLKCNSLLKPLIEVLYANSCLKDYMTLIQSL